MDSVYPTAVWWDIENCRPPSDVNPYHIARNIRTVLHTFHFNGPLTISAYGDTGQLHKRVQDALASTGVGLNHIPSGRKEASDKAIVMNMAFWTGDHPPPANVLLITGDRDFSPLLHQLQMRRYNVVLARPEGVHVSESLLNSASTVWYWSRLARAEIDYLCLSRDTTRTGNQVYIPKSSGGENPGPIARPPFPPPYRPPVMMHDTMHPPASPPMMNNDYRHPMMNEGYPPYPNVHLDMHGSLVNDMRNPMMNNFRNDLIPRQPDLRHRAPLGNELRHKTPPNHQEAPLFLQWPSSPQCFSGINDFQERDFLPVPDGGREYLYARSVIRRTLDTLRLEMMVPNESNIYNCIVYGERRGLDFDLKQALEQGIKMGELVTKDSTSRGERIFLPAGCELWNYVDPNMCHEYDADIWSDLRNFLCGEEVHSFLNSANQYAAALVLRRRGIGRLSDLALGQIYNVIQMAIIVRLWVKPHPQNWTPLTVTFARNSFGGVEELEEKKVDVVHQASPAVLEAWEDVHFELTALDIVNKVLEDSMGTDVVNHPLILEDNTEPEIKIVPEVKQTTKAATKVVKEQPVSIMKELKAWLPSVLTAEGYDISLLRNDFKAARGLTLDHLALGYPKLMDLMKQFPDVVQISYPKPGLCKLYPAGVTPAVLERPAGVTPAVLERPAGVTPVVLERPGGVTPVVLESTTNNEKTIAQEIMQSLRAWLPVFIGKRGGVCDLTTTSKEFEKETKWKLDSLGYSSFGKLFEQFADIVRMEPLQSGDLVLTLSTKGPTNMPAISKQDRLAADCKTLLLENIPNCKAGYPLAKLKADFQQRFGKPLDHAKCGFKKLEMFLDLLKDSVEVRSGSGGHKLLYLKEVPGAEQLVEDEETEGYDEDSELSSAVEDKPETSPKLEERAAPANKELIKGGSKKRGKSQQGSKPVQKQIMGSQLPVYLRHCYIEKVATSTISMKPTNPLSMVD